MAVTGAHGMRVLIACERSGIVRRAFRIAGHDAYSNDLVAADDGDTHHFTGDCIKVIEMGWDLIIAHPPCTALAVSGNGTYGAGKPKHGERLEAIKWTLSLWDLIKKNSDMAALENPVGVLPMKPAQYIQPWQFGHGEQKKTGLWLHNLPPLTPTNIVEGREQRVWKMPPGPERQRLRSETYKGVAEAMAKQWGNL